MQVVTSAQSPLYVDFLPAAALDTPGRLGMTFAPGKKGAGLQYTWNRDLDLDLDRLRADAGCDVLVSLMEPHEYARYGIVGLAEGAERRGVAFVRFPIRDVSVPTDMAAFARLVDSVLGQLRAGQVVVVHCLGGKGRTGLVTAACLVRAGYAPDDAIRCVRAARPGTVETGEQARFVARYAAWLGGTRADWGDVPRSIA